MPIEALRIKVGEKDELDVAIHVPEDPIAYVISLHGLESDKEGNKPYLLADRLLRDGIGVVRFDFRGCGKSTGDFADTNVATRIADTIAVMRAIETRPGGECLGLFGSSMGGYVALFVATEPDFIERIRATVTLAAPANLDDLAGSGVEQDAHLRGFVAEWKRGEYLRVPHGVCNALLLHGEADETVPVAHVEDIWHGLEEPRKQLLFPNCDHRFSDVRDLETAIAEAAAWFHTHLRPAEG